MPVNNLNKYSGRFNQPVATTNLSDPAHYPEFEVFEDFEPDALPRAARGAQPLSVYNIDMCQYTNKQNHYTSNYDIQKLVVRRGQEFTMKVTFNRPLTPDDMFQVEFLIGSNPSPSTNTLVVVTFDSRRGGPWSGQIVDTQGQTLTLGITPSASAIVGKFSTYVGIVMANGVLRTKRDTNTDLYLLFNAWAEDDDVFYPDEEGRQEYVLNDHGVIYQGIYEPTLNVPQRSWDFGQFERGVLDACIYILDVSKMPISDRGDIIKLTRMGSAMFNSQDDNGVLVGNWSDDFSMGKPPTSWTGSVGILLKYASGGVPVCYGQCWVYAGVFNTFLRCLGIPARVITNFVSAHDNNGNLVINLIYQADGSLDTENTKDSIWNFHCWNEAYMARADLPPGLGGWQVVDSTPQETSDGYFRCGPASVAAIKEGLLCHPFDLNFVFAEVNSEVVSSKIDRYRVLTPFKIDKNYVGKAVLTKSIGSRKPDNVTNNYKFPKGSPDDIRVMTQAQEFGSRREQPQLPTTLLSVDIITDQVELGQDMNLVVEFTNNGKVSRTVNACLLGSVIFYTGIRAALFKNETFTVTVPAKQKFTKSFTITAQEYLQDRGCLNSLRFTVTGKSDDQSVSSMKVVTMKVPKLTLTVSGQPKVQQQMFVTVTFTNPLSFSLEKAVVTMEGSGLMSPKSRSYSVIAPQASITWKETIIPRVVGLRHITASMDCANLRGVVGYLDVNITY